MKRPRFAAVYLCTILFSYSCRDTGRNTNVFQQNPEQMRLSGAAIINNHCTECHSFTQDCNQFSGVMNRLPSEAYFRQFISAQDSLLKNEDPYTKELHQKWSSGYMHHFSFSPAEVDSLKIYLKKI